jgi:endoglucanase
VHLLDFTDLAAAGHGYQVHVSNQRSHSFRIAPDLYEPLARDAFGLFYLLRSGLPIDERRAPAMAIPPATRVFTEPRRHHSSRLDRTRS